MTKITHQDFSSYPGNILFQYYWPLINDVQFSKWGDTCQDYIVAIFKIKWKS